MSSLRKLRVETRELATPAGFDITRHFPENPTVFIRDGQGIIGFGEAARFEASGPNRIAELAGLWREQVALAEITDRSKWEKHPTRSVILTGHLSSSMRYYRNDKLEEWVNAVLSCRWKNAKTIATDMRAKGHTVWITRSLAAAKEWVRKQCNGVLRSGIIASGQAKRLAAEGLFVDFKPDIATWMLAPTSDIRSSNALEVVQNQYQVQGLELDFCIVCWDADLRHDNGEWKAYKISGSSWANDKLGEVAKNGYRVLLTRARKGLVIFVPVGDRSRNDHTRAPEFYDASYRSLIQCGAVDLQAK
jgi:hypothetical protein